MRFPLLIMIWGGQSLHRPLPRALRAKMNQMRSWEGSGKGLPSLIHDETECDDKVAARLEADDLLSGTFPNRCLMTTTNGGRCAAGTVRWMCAAFSSGVLRSHASADSWLTCFMELQYSAKLPGRMGSERSSTSLQCRYIAAATHVGALPKAFGFTRAPSAQLLPPLDRCASRRQGAPPSARPLRRTELRKRPAATALG